jgi:hypothetical protein
VVPNGNDVLTRPAWVDAALAEYEAHRAEVVAEAEARQHTLAFGATAVGIVAAGGFNVWDEKLVATVAFLAAVPLISAFVLIQWAGRAAAMMRVGVYLERLETSIGQATGAPSPLFTWERTLAGMRPDQPWRPQAGWNDFGAVAVFALLAEGSVILGAYRGWSGNELLILVTAAIETLVLVLMTAAIGRGVATTRREARRRFPANAESPDDGSAADGEAAG